MPIILEAKVSLRHAACCNQKILCLDNLALALIGRRKRDGIRREERRRALPALDCPTLLAALQRRAVEAVGLAEAEELLLEMLRTGDYGQRVAPRFDG